jgi:ribokinase
VDKIASYKKQALIDDIKLFGGGCVSTAMVTVQRLGGKTAIIGCLGNDQTGKDILSELEEEGIDCQGIEIRDNVASTFSFIQVNKKLGKRAIAFFPGSSLLLKLNKKAEEIIKRSRMLILDGMRPLEDIKAAKFAHNNNIKVMLDCNIFTRGTTELLSYIDYIIASESFLYDFSGVKDVNLSLKKVSKEYNPLLMAATLGNKGSIALIDGKIVKEGIYNVEVKDTTGCGDVYHGAFVFGLLKNWDTINIMKFATAVSSMKCMHYGGRPGIPNFRETLRFLKEHGENIEKFK